jgi:hypothetical protein
MNILISFLLFIASFAFLEFIKERFDLVKEQVNINTFYCFLIFTFYNFIILKFYDLPTVIINYLLFIGYEFTNIFYNTYIFINYLISKFIFHKKYNIHYIKIEYTDLLPTELVCDCPLCYMTENINNFMFNKLNINKNQYSSSSELSSSVK